MADLLSTSATVFACLSKVCAPPPVGKGGSLKTTGGKAPAHEVVGGRVRLNDLGRVDRGSTPDGLGGMRVEDSTELVFGTSSQFELESMTIDAKIKANRAVSSNLAKDREFSSWVESNKDRPVADFGGMARLLKNYGREVPDFRRHLADIVDDPSGASFSSHLIATVDEVGEAMRRAFNNPDITNSEAIARILVRPMIDAWADSATTEESARFQIAAAAVHNAPITGYKKAFPDDFAEAKESMKDGYALEQWMHEALVRAEYAATQQWFKERGIKSLVLYRGMRDVRGDLEAGDMAKIDANPLSSWTTTRSMAQQFAVLDGTSSVREVSDNLVIAMEVPVSAIQSIPFTGRGCLVETEVVVIGKPATALVTDTSDTLAALIKKRNEDTMNGMADSGLWS